MERGMTADQVLAALWRRKLLVGAIAAAAFVVGAAIVAALPSVYKATAVVQVNPQRPSEELVRHTVSELLEQRLLTIRQEVLARPILEQTIQELNLYPELVTDHGMDAAIERMRRDIDVKVEGDTAFELTYSARDAETAAKVANRLPAIWSERTAQTRQAQAAIAAGLFADEVEQLGKSLADWERKIAQFKVDHMGELPEQLEANMRSLERTVMEIDSRSDELRMADARRSDLVQAHAAMDTEAGRLKAAEDAKVQELIGARNQWTEDHPEVQRLSKDLEALKAKREEAEGQMFAQRSERARAIRVVRQLEAQIATLQQQAKAFQSRIDNTPRWAHELAVMGRDYDAARARYQSVLARQVDVQLAQELEIRGSQAMYKILSAAGVPASAASPDRVGGLLIALLAALGLAVLAGLVLEMRDESIRDPSELKGRLPLPVLAVVPNVRAGKGARRILRASSGRNEAVPESLN